MARVTLFATIVFTYLVLLHSAEGEKQHSPHCVPFRCGELGFLRFPFSDTSSPEYGPFPMQGCNEKVQKINLGSKWLQVKKILSMNPPQEELKGGENVSSYFLNVHDQEFQDSKSDSDDCDLNSLTFPSHYSSFNWTIQLLPNRTFFKCSHSVNRPSKGFEHTRCGKYNFFYKSNDSSKFEPQPQCPEVVLPVEHFQGQIDLREELKSDYHIILQSKNGTMFCPSKRELTKEGNVRFALKIGLGIGFPVIIMIGLVVYFLHRKRKRKHGSPDTFSTSNSSYPSNADLEGGSVYYGVPVFSYKELEEATNNFDHSKELGDGGFGTVYYGKLRDGREVAVKRLYEHNYRRVEQFMNEIEILTRLRHKHLVSLYGCTSRKSRELLLVYEYIPNGTVADHLHGDRAKPGSLTWSTRMSIAVETANALAYLHASDIIHRDVKTNNILLDINFSVKVADFGLSRLFPIDVTHVSTAPQGTPGYVDPEYHQCYQLTDKSDVYSFGVVLVELISSMPAVDISRHRHEINLSNMAIAKIQKKAYNELVDPTLGFESDSSVKKMVMMVAELAFRCLQQDKEMRPSMDEVLEALQEIESGELKLVSIDKAHIKNVESESVLPPPSPECDEVGLLKRSRQPSSPISVTEKWISRSTTPNSSA